MKRYSQKTSMSWMNSIIFTNFLNVIDNVVFLRKMVKIKFKCWNKINFKKMVFSTNFKSNRSKFMSRHREPLTLIIIYIAS